jgi:hypothetical protein
MRTRKLPARIPTGALLVPKLGREGQVLSHSRTPIYLGWDHERGGMRLLFPDGIVSTHDADDVLDLFEEATP